MRTALVAIVSISAACGPAKSDSVAAGSSAVSAETNTIDIDSKDILNRNESSPEVYVKHVLIAWQELHEIDHDHIDPHASKRSNTEAARLARDLAGKLRANPDAIDNLIKDYSEDPSARWVGPYVVDAAAQFEHEFKALASHLKMNEVGIVRTKLGYHVVIRVPPSPRDPLESSEILARPMATGPVLIQQILIGWNDTPAAKTGHADSRANARDKAAADKLALDVLAKVRAGDEMAGLMKQFSEDLNSKDSARAFSVGPDTPMLEQVKKLALQLHDGEAGLVRSPQGWHIVKRVPPPPPDPLESVDVLARPNVAQKVTIKQILLNWNGNLNWKDSTRRYVDNPRAHARDRATLEKLVKDTVAKIKAGAKIEDLMKALSEDSSTAGTGETYELEPSDRWFPPGCKAIALRLNVHEVGVAKSNWGIHIMLRTE